MGWRLSDAENVLNDGDAAAEGRKRELNLREMKLSQATMGADLCRPTWQCQS